MNNEQFSYNMGSRGYGVSLSYEQYVSRTFRWMAVGLLLTFATALTVPGTPLFGMVYSMYLPLTIAELALVFVLGARVNSLQVNTARMLFVGYSVLNGLVLSIYFAMFDVRTLTMAFLASALYFGIMAMYGAKSSRNLLSWGPALSAALLSLIICGFVGTLFRIGFMTGMMYSAIGLGLFMLITARDMQMMQYNYRWFARDDAMLEKSAVFTALQLYLDFINIFMYVLRMFARRDDD